MDNQGEKEKKLFEKIGLKEILILTALVILLFYGGYFLSFHFWDRNCVQEHIITFNVTKNDNSLLPQPNQIYLTDDQFSMIQNDIEQIKNTNAKTLENNLSVSTLNDFYSALFTAIAVIIAIIALTSWGGLDKKITRLENIMKDYEVIQPDVDYLLKKKKYSRWIQEKFSSEEIEHSYDLNLTDEDKATYNEMESHITELHEEEAWIEMIIAHEHIYKKDDIIEAEKIYQFIESRNIFPDNSRVEPILYHLLGQLYKKKYDINKDQNTDIEKENLLKAEEYYLKSLDKRIERDKQRTRSNLAVVYIELGKQELKHYYSYSGENTIKPEFYFNKAKEQLIKAEKQGHDYNVYWDQARVAFYLNDESEKIRSLLMKATNNIPSSAKAKESFVEKLLQEIDEFSEYGHKGFPGDKTIIQEIIRKLRISY